MTEVRVRATSHIEAKEVMQFKRTKEKRQQPQKFKETSGERKTRWKPREDENGQGRHGDRRYVPYVAQKSRQDLRWPKYLPLIVPKI